MDVKTELSQEARAQRRQVRSDGELFSQLMLHEGWRRYIALVETVAQNHYKAVMKPVDSILECGKIEYNKGVLSGLSLATALPTMKVNEANELHHRDEE